MSNVLPIAALAILFFAGVGMVLFGVSKIPDEMDKLDDDSEHGV